MRKPSPRSPSLIPAPQFIEWRSGHGSLEPLRTIAETPKGQEHNHPEGYVLAIDPDGTTVTAGSTHAQSAGRKTWQQLQAQIPDGSVASALTIRDYPSLSM